MQWEPLGILPQQGTLKDMPELILRVGGVLRDATTWSHSHTPDIIPSYCHTSLLPRVFPTLSGSP